jgi:integrase
MRRQLGAWLRLVLVLVLVQLGYYNRRVVSERLGHASPTVTLSVYAHVLPGDQRTAAVAFAAMIGEA